MSHNCLSCLKTFFFEGGWGRQIKVHDGYIHRLTGLNFLWITGLELRSGECNYLLSDKLTLSLVCTLTAKPFQLRVACTGSE